MQEGPWSSQEGGPLGKGTIVLKEVEDVGKRIKTILPQGWGSQTLTESLGGLVKNRLLGPSSKVSDSLCLKWGLRICIFPASLVAQMVKNLPAIWETLVWSLGWEDPLEEGMATHSSILTWRVPMDRGAWRATVHGVARVGHHWVTKHKSLVCQCC